MSHLKGFLGEAEADCHADPGSDRHRRDVGRQLQEPDADRVGAAFVRFRAILAERYAATPPVALPGVAAAIATLRSRGIKAALTTGFDDDVAYPLLASLGWGVGPSSGDTVDAVVTTSDVSEGRPVPCMIPAPWKRRACTTSARSWRPVTRLLTCRRAATPAVWQWVF